MMKLNEMPKMAQVGLVVALAVAATAGLYFLAYKSMDDQIKADTVKLAAKEADIRTLRPFEKNLPELDRQIESLKQQMEIQRRIVPDAKEADNFMHLLQNTAASAGIEIRRYNAKATTAKEFYTEVPFEMELDGPYYSMMNFFEKVSKLERIINVGNLQLGAVQNKDTKVKHGAYQYAPSESVVGTCVTTTFFSREATKAQPGAQPPAKK